jgi:hypothetical protein
MYREKRCLVLSQDESEKNSALLQYTKWYCLLTNIIPKLIVSAVKKKYDMQVLITLKLCVQHFVIFCIDTRTPYPSSGNGNKKPVGLWYEMEMFCS